jgi:C1A family cysteine protease
MKDYSQYKLGVIKSPEDKRDYVFSKIYKTVELPRKTNNMDSMFPARDQGSQGSCAAMSGAAMKEWQEIKDVELKEYLSPQFIYNLRANQDSEGMINRDLMKIIQDKGVCLESSYPYGTFRKPSEEVLKQAECFRINNYARIYTLEELKQALFLKGPCVVAIPVYNYTERMWYQNPGDELLGGHDMCVVDYDDDERVLWIRNSWGTEFGLAGYIKMSYDDFNLAWEWWSSVDLPTTYPPIDPIDPIEPEKLTCWQKIIAWLKKLFHRES